MISGCKITQLKLNLHPINRSFFHDGAKRAKIGYTHADARGADTDARRVTAPFRLRTYRLIRKILIGFILVSIANVLFSYFFYTPKMYRILSDNREIVIRYRILQDRIRTAQRHVDEIRHRDNYHHTMFEMLGNWSYGDYFKKEAIEWAWELLGGVYKLPADRMYATVFEGSEEDGVPFDQEAYDYWKQFLPEDHIIRGNKHDNFWEMGETVPAVPARRFISTCATRRRSPPSRAARWSMRAIRRVIEIWNLVFMQFNRKANGSLEPLRPANVDTGHGASSVCA